MTDFTDQVAVVTGAGAGLGRSYALALADRGAKVVVNDIGVDAGSGGATAEAVAEEIRSLGGTAVTSGASVATPEGGAQVVQEALDAFGAVDVLVNNAGNMELSSFAKLDVRSIADVLDVHVGGAFYTTQPAYRSMIERGRGRIVFTTSGIGAFGIYGASVYGAAKGAINGLLNVLKLEAPRHGLRVNAVAPMATTQMSADDLYADVSEQSSSPELVAPVVLYLASEACEVNGEVWSCGAGTVARLFTGRSPGYFKHPEREGSLTPEDVASNVRAIRDAAGYEELADWTAEWRTIVERHFGGGAQ